MINEGQVTEAIIELLKSKDWSAEYIDVYTHPSNDSISVTLRGIKETED